jgi:dephospho-CoA kinase
MRRIGLTGGIASGKSAATRAFEALGITVVDADLAARAVVAPGTDGLAAVIAQLGREILTPDGELNRTALRERVFADAEARQALEALLHPRIRQWLAAQTAAAAGPYVIVAIPLLAEGGGRAAYPWLDRVLVVDTPASTQLARLQARDGGSEALARQMLAAQASREVRLAIADDVLVNTGTLDDLQAAVARLDARYRALPAEG